MSYETTSGFLGGVKVLEIADELGEYCGKVLAGLGADVIKVEPPGGERTRSYGPFHEDRPGLENSLYFWHYNFGKRGIVLDLDAEEDQARLRTLASTADVLIDTRARGYLSDRGLGEQQLRELNPALIVARLSPFGDTGPWADYKASDLVHLALGGVMMNCGYDPDPSGFYETPPIAPQMWQAYHIAGEITVIAILGALTWRLRTGCGQYLSTAVHEAVAKQTETDMPDWVYARLPHFRLTCRHSRPDKDSSVAIALTKDGRWILPYKTYLRSGDQGEFEATVKVLTALKSAADLAEAKYLDPKYRAEPEVNRHINDVTMASVGRFLSEREIWRDFQSAKLAWAPVRRPEENLDDEHWKARETFIQVEHPELGKTFTEIGAKWMSREVPWRKGPRAPMLGEHTDQVLAALDKEVRHESSPRVEVVKKTVETTTPSPQSGRNGHPWALQGVRFIDLSWLLASAGAGRYLSAMGAEVIKVEHKTKPDFIRWGNGMAPDGGREERDRATGPLRYPRPASPNRSGFFMEINSGKRAISLNLKHPRGKEILTQLLKTADIVAEGFSPGTMDRMGFGYERLKEINPRIVYAQQSGMGQIGTYGEMRSYGPVAQAFSGLSEMSGLPEPYPPAGIGYSFLDWSGAYNMAVAIMAGLYRQQVTGKGCWIDSSQVESGTYLTGTAVLDYTANGHRWYRYGNRSPYRLAAPHGAYRTKGEDRWVAISCFTEKEWEGLVEVLGRPGWANDPRFKDLVLRTQHQDELDALVNAITAEREGYQLMDQLQRAGVPAGVCQTAEDRYDLDPQLKHLQWMVELRQSEIGTWPVKEFPVKFSETPPYMGGTIERHGPNYGEDNEYVYGELLGMSSQEIRELREAEVI